MVASSPDILLVVLDTLRRDRLSAYGHKRETSPAFDAFTERATLFERAVAPAQWTVPSHASMFTGLYPTTHQLTQADGQLSPELTTLAERLATGGYRTVGFCNNPLVGILDNGLTRGFEDFYNYAGAAPNRPHDVTRSRVRRAVQGRWTRFAKTVSQRFAHNDWLFRLSLNPWLTPIWTRSVNYKGNTAHAIDDMIDVLGQHRAGGRDRPMFGFLNLMGGHMPLRPPETYLKRYAPEISRDRDAYRFMARFNADAARWASPTDPPLSAWERQVIDGFYDAEVAHQDYHLGRLLRHLEASGARDDTMVIIVADHGEGHGDHDFFGHSFVVYQELVHVPLLIAYPEQFPQATRVASNISTRRLYHTILSAANLLDDDTPDAALSLARSTNCKPDTESGLAFAEAIPPQTFLSVLRHRNPAAIDRLNLTRARRAVYQDDMKLAVVDDSVEALFDVARDPAETDDIAPAHDAQARALKAEIDAFVQMAVKARVDAGLSGQMSSDMLDNLRALGYID